MGNKSVAIFLAVSENDKRMAKIARSETRRSAIDKANGFAVAECAAQKVRLSKETLHIVALLLCDLASGARGLDSAVQYLYIYCNE